MSIIEKVWPLREDKRKKLERDVTPQKDMPACVDCLRQIVGAAVMGYDGKWRDLSCNALHTAAVLKETGESAPVPSDEKQFKIAAPESEESRKTREDRVKQTLERYGVSKKA